MKPYRQSPYRRSFNHIAATGVSATYPPASHLSGRGCVFFDRHQDGTTTCALIDDVSGEVLYEVTGRDLAHGTVLVKRHAAKRGITVVQGFVLGSGSK